MSSATTKTPKTAKEINDRMSEIGAELAKYRFGFHPNWRALVAEENYLKSIYDDVLKAGASTTHEHFSLFPEISDATDSTTTDGTDRSRTAVETRRG
jgi:hypothetical protein